MSRSEKNILRYLGVMAIISKLVLEQGMPSKSVLKMLTKINEGFDATRAEYPELISQSKNCNKIEAELNCLDIKKKIHLLFLTSTCLGGFEDAAQKLKGKRLAAVDSCITSINRLHVYFDRKFNHDAEYVKASKLIKAWGF